MPEDASGPRALLARLRADGAGLSEDVLSDLRRVSISAPEGRALERWIVAEGADYDTNVVTNAVEIDQQGGGQQPVPPRRGQIERGAHRSL